MRFMRHGAAALVLTFAGSLTLTTTASAQFAPGPGQGGRFERDGGSDRTPGFDRDPRLDRGERFDRRAREGRRFREDTVMGFSRERLGRIGPVMREQVERAMFPGAVTLIARRGRIIHFEAHGFRDGAKTQPMTRDTIFMLASMTKPIVSTAAVMLIEQGRMKLSDPITNWLTELRDLKVEARRTNPDGTTATEDVALSRPITVQDLLRHSAGFTYAGSVRSPRIKQLIDDQNIEGRTANIAGDEMLRRLGQIPLTQQPGTNFEYSISVDVLGLLLERVTGKRLDVLIKEMILDPLDMRDTAWFVPEARRSRLAEALDSDPLKAPFTTAYRIFENPAESGQYLRGGSGMVSTAEDYFRFAQMILNGGEFEGVRLLSSRWVNFMLSNHLVGMGGSTAASTGPGYGFGLGFAVRLQDGFAVAPGSTGDAMWAGAWGTSFTIDPREGVVGILMAQGPSNRVHTRMLFKNLIYGALVR
jgi:CubicO group peptidase (beta-lactamase class C family)